ALPVAQALDGAYAVAQRGRGLESQLLRRLLHLPREAGGELLRLAGQYQLRLGDGVAVGLAAERAQAPAGAGAHVVVQAGALPANVPREAPRAGGQLQRLAHRVDDVLGLRPPAEGPEIARRVLGRPV